MPVNKTTGFRRTIPDTIVGLVHVLAGSISFFYSLARIIVIGFGEVFRYGDFIGIYNYFNESTPLILWISGVGILRGKRWGRVAAVIWALSVILLDIISYKIRYYYWGLIAMGLSWGDILILYYALFLLIYILARPLYGLIKERVDFERIDFSYLRRRFYNIIYWRRR